MTSQDSDTKPSEPPKSEQTDILDVYTDNRKQPRDLRKFPALVGSALKVVWTASPEGLLSTSTLGLIGGLLAASQVLLGKFAFERLLEAGRSNNVTLGSVLLPLVLLAGVAVATTGSTTWLAQRLRLLGEQVQRVAWDEVLDVTTSVSLVDFESPDFFNRLQRVQANALARPIAVAQSLVTLIAAGVGLIAIGVSLFLVQPLLIPILALGGFPAWFLAGKGSRTEFTFAIAQTPPARERFYIRDILTGRPQAAEIRAFLLQRFLRSRYEANYDIYIKDFKQQVRLRLRLALLANVANLIVAGIAIAVLTWLLVHHHVTLAEAGAVALAVRLLGSRLQQLVNAVAGLYESALFLQDQQDFRALASATTTHDAGAHVPPFQTLRAEGVSFTYPGSPRPALDDVTVELSAQSLVAVVGENGSGKSTLAKVIAHLYEPQHGRVTWDGIDTRDLDPAQVRDSTAVLFQDFVQFHLSARTNIEVGRPEPARDLQVARDAAQRAGADHFLASLPRGYDTTLSKEFDGGLELSLGQWQRVALARAFYRDSPLLILDEPSAALDPRAESELMQSVRELARGRTVLLISHRFSNVRLADRIFVMHAGRVVESGTHDELMGQAGRYSELYRLQADAYS